MPRYRMQIAYDGSDYSGWQVQPSGITIQEKLQDAAKIIFQEHVRITGAGRTDAGVHALCQIAHFDTERELDLKKFLSSMNGILPMDIRVLKVEKAPEDFHSRYSTKNKIYQYKLCCNRYQDPCQRLYRLHCKQKMDMELMKKAAKEFEGTHDFRTFANEASQGTAGRNSVRTVERAELIDEGDGMYRLEFEGPGFLYKMVRNMTGTILEVASGKRPLKGIAELFAAKDRRKAGKSAPALGLTLYHIDYE